MIDFKPSTFFSAIFADPGMSPICKMLPLMVLLHREVTSFILMLDSSVLDIFGKIESVNFTKNFPFLICVYFALADHAILEEHNLN